MSTHLTRTLEITCENCNLGKICIPRGMQQNEVAALGNLLNRNNIRRKNEIIYHAGSTFRGIMALRSGSAKLVSIDKDGNEYVAAFILPGELLGFDGLAQQIHHCTAVALETTNFCHLPPAQMEWLSIRSGSMGQILLQRSAEQYSQQLHRLIQSRRQAEERVAHFILDISERLGKLGYSDTEFRLSMSREDIGNHLGIALETVSRIINHFQAMRMIAVKAKQVKIIDKKRLLDYHIH